MKALEKKFHFKHYTVTAYRSQANGLVEEFNKILKQILRKLSEGLGNWDEYLPSVLFAYRTSHIKNVRISSDILTYRQNMRLLNEAIKRESVWDKVKHIVTQIPVYRQKALEKIIKL